MVETVELIIINPQNEILLMLRDNIPNLPFPNTWDLFGGHIEEGETPDQALVREIHEELAWNISDFTFFRQYEFLTGDVQPTRKFVYYAMLNVPYESLVLGEGQEMRFFRHDEIDALPFANVNKKLVLDFYESYEQLTQRSKKSI